MRDSREIERVSTMLQPIFARHMEIAAVYLFGSHATTEETAQSDIDLGVVYRQPQDLMGELALEAEICAALGVERLDLVNLIKARVSLQFRAIQSGAVVYCADERARADFVEMVLDRHGDYGLSMQFLSRDFLDGLKEETGDGRP